MDTLLCPQWGISQNEKATVDIHVLYIVNRFLDGFKILDCKDKTNNLGFIKNGQTKLLPSYFQKYILEQIKYDLANEDISILHKSLSKATKDKEFQWKVLKQERGVQRKDKIKFINLYDYIQHESITAGDIINLESILKSNNYKLDRVNYKLV